MPRQIIPGFPHHVTQRGSRRQTVFFSDADYATYLEILAEEMAAQQVRVWAYCLMPNHVHLVVAPPSAEALAVAMREAQGTYARHVNRAHGWTGHLWHARYFACAMDERHAIAATRYVLQNPVRAQLVAAPEAWRFSSVRDLLGQERDPVVTREPLRGLVSEWTTLLHAVPEPREVGAIRHHVSRGKPMGTVAPIVQSDEGKSPAEAA